MTYGDVPVTIVVRGRMFICVADRTFISPVPARKRARALDAGRQAFANELRAAVMAESVPTWDFS